MFQLASTVGASESLCGRSRRKGFCADGCLGEFVGFFFRNSKTYVYITKSIAFVSSTSRVFALPRQGQESSTLLLSSF